MIIIKKGREKGERTKSRGKDEKLSRVRTMTPLMNLEEVRERKRKRKRERKREMRLLSSKRRGVCQTEGVYGINTK